METCTFGVFLVFFLFFMFLGGEKAPNRPDSMPKLGTLVRVSGLFVRSEFSLI